MSLLQKVLGEREVESAIVFAKTKRGANMLAERLVRGGIQAAVIHGNKSQSARQRALDAFKNRQVKVLVATDIAARGIDIDNISHIVNYDMPVDAESYVHRIGRTGRAGAEGIAITFCTATELGELRDIETLIGKSIPLAPNQVRPRAAESEPRSRGRTGSASSGRGGGDDRSRSSRKANSMNGNSHSVRSSNGRNQASRPSTRGSSSRPATATAHTPAKPRPVNAAGESTTGARPAAVKAKRPLQRKIRKLTGRTTFGSV